NGVTFGYTYDGNERLTTIDCAEPVVISYEAGTNNRRSITNGTTSTVFRYDAGGRMSAREDTVDGRRFTRLFEYDGNDNLTAVTYASGRRMTYAFDSENRITQVRDASLGRNIATTFSYHPSGMVASFTSGNQVVNTATFDATRYWVR